DIKLVNNYLKTKASVLKAEELTAFEALVKTMQAFYAPIDFKVLQDDLSKITEKNEATLSVSNFLKDYTQSSTPEQISSAIANVLYTIRTHITDFKYSKNRLAILDLSIQLENTLLKESQEWE